MNRECRERAGLPWARWAGLLALLVAEVLLLTLRFDGGDVPADSPAYRAIIQTGRFARSGLTVGAILLFVAALPCYRELTNRVSAGRLPLAGRPLAATLGNLVACVGFYRLSAQIFEGARGPLVGWPLVVAWWLAGLAALVFWGLAVLPAVTWAVLARRCAGSLALGATAGIAAVGAGQLAQNQWEPFSRSTLQVVHVLLDLVVSDAVCVPERLLVGTSTFRVAISPACSGYEGVGLVGVLIALALALFRRELKFPRALVLVPLSMAIIWLVNAARIAALVLLGAWGYPRLAVEGFHSMAGSVLFLLIGLGLIAVIRRLPFFSSRTPPQAE
jgi:exosortase/archaeosortase family protein